MGTDPSHDHDRDAEELLRRALLDAEASASVALRVHGLSMCEALTVIFHGRRDLGTIQTYVAHGRHGAGTSVGASELLRVPCDLDLAAAEDRDDAEQLYVQQAEALRDALLAADTVLAIWREPLADVAGREVAVDRSIELHTPLPAHRLMPIALVAPERQLTVTPVCGARTLAEGRPPLGIACVQQDVSHVYSLPEDPESCLRDFLERSAEHARRLADRLNHQEVSVERFLELSDESA
ncbi:MAG TPA: hypothetical protein VGY97_12485 [Solirubrobacteraceae bacterium]|jgi:hypothetical protein|nr:hypothetical protein [Solirubrobacteraceae bacterium]